MDLFDDEKFVSDGMNIIERKVKRVIDCLLAFLCLVVFSPLFVILYILIKYEDGGKVIYKQERIGLFGRPFYIYKFRSMKLNAEENGPQLCMSDEVNDFVSIISTNFRNYGMCLLATWHLSVLVPRENTTSTKFWSGIPDMCSCIRYVLVSQVMPPCITATPTRWTKC